jgi:hypothetical protein
MESLLQQFGDLAIAGATVSHHNPYLGPNDPAPDSVVIHLDMTLAGAWEKACNLRWPDKPEFEKLVLETRFGKAVTWEQMPGLMDEYMIKWGKDQYYCHICEFGLSRIAHRNRDRIRALRGLTVRSMSVSQYYATALVTNDHTNLNYGSIWSFPVIHYENPIKAEWTNTLIEVKAYQVSHILETTLYVVDGAELVCIDLTDKKELYRINMYEKYKLMLFNTDFICASMSGFILIVSEKNGFSLFFENTNTMTVDLVEHIATPTVDGKAAAFTTGCLDLEKAVLGRSDGKVEIWSIQRTEVEGKVITKIFRAEVLDVFIDQVSDHNMRPLKMVPDDPVTNVYSRGRRLMIISKNNRVSMEMLKGTPITMMDENKDLPIVAVSVFGDFTGVLYANAAVELGRYSGTKPVYVHSNKKTNLEQTQRINIGEQRIAVLADMVIILSQQGHMFNLDLNQLKK